MQKVTRCSLTGEEVNSAGVGIAGRRGAEAAPPLQFAGPTRDVLHELARQRPGQLIAQALEAEAAGYLQAYADCHDAGGHRLVVPNGHKPPRSILTGVGPVEVHQPRVEHWAQLRTTKPVERTFASVRLRTDKTKGSASRVACLVTATKLAASAQRSWRRLNGSAWLRAVIQGVRFIDGLKAIAAGYLPE